jgi:hypothetical protein
VVFDAQAGGIVDPPRAGRRSGPADKPLSQARAAMSGRAAAPTGSPVLDEMFEVVLLARNPDGSTSVGLRWPTGGDVRVIWPT